MTGEDLYNLWAEAMGAEGCDAGEWYDLEALEQRAWDALAEKVKLA